MNKGRRRQRALCKKKIQAICEVYLRWFGQRRVSNFSCPARCSECSRVLPSPPTYLHPVRIHPVLPYGTRGKTLIWQVTLAGPHGYILPPKRKLDRQVENRPNAGRCAGQNLCYSFAARLRGLSVFGGIGFDGAGGKVHAL